MEESYRSREAEVSGLDSEPGCVPDAESGMGEVRRCLDDALHIHLEGGVVEPSKPGRN